MFCLGCVDRAKALLCIVQKNNFPLAENNRKRKMTYHCDFFNSTLC